MSAGGGITKKHGIPVRSESINGVRTHFIGKA
jgi:hypothetical protein